MFVVFLIDNTKDAPLHVLALFKANMILGILHFEQKRVVLETCWFKTSSEIYMLKRCYK